MRCRDPWLSVPFPVSSLNYQFPYWLFCQGWFRFKLLKFRFFHCFQEKMNRRQNRQDSRFVQPPFELHTATSFSRVTLFALMADRI